MTSLISTIDTVYLTTHDLTIDDDDDFINHDGLSTPNQNNIISVRSRK